MTYRHILCKKECRNDEKILILQNNRKQSLINIKVYMAKELKELTKRSENYSQWYNDLVVKADLAEQSAV